MSLRSSGLTSHQTPWRAGARGLCCGLGSLCAATWAEFGFDSAGKAVRRTGALFGSCSREALWSDSSSGIDGFWKTSSPQVGFGLLSGAFAFVSVLAIGTEM